MAELAGVVLAGPALIEPAVHLAKYLRELLRTYRHGDEFFQDMRLRIDARLVDVSNMAQFFGKTIENLEPFTRGTVDQLLIKLHVLLLGVEAAAKAHIGSDGSLRKDRFTFRGKDALSRLDLELGDWRERVGNIMFTLSLIEGRKMPAVVVEQGQAGPGGLGALSVILPKLLLDSKDTAQALRLKEDTIKHSTGQLIGTSRARFHDGERRYISELHHDTASMEEVRDIAAFLRASDRDYVALLRCNGFYGHALELAIPAHFQQPQTLRQILEAGERDKLSLDKLALDARLRLMKRLASALVFIHLADHVHKSIRPDNILIFPSSKTDGTGLGEPVLIGFDLSRKHDKRSQKIKVAGVEKYYYLAPDRQGDWIRDYSMLDDIYSLGVVFLEIALGFSFVKSQPTAAQTDSKIHWQRHSILMDEGRPAKPLEAEALRLRLVSQAKKTAARRMGSTIAGLIVSCLSCLNDPDAFGDRTALEDKDGIVVGIAYMKEVLAVLDQVSY